MKVENGVLYRVCQEDINADGSFIVPNRVKGIGYSAFFDCSWLISSVTFGKGVTTIGHAAFRGCSKLTSVIVPNTVTSIGYSAFRYCTKLTSVIIGNRVKSIEGYAFKNCPALTSITIPNSVKSIGSEAFRNCVGLTSVTIGKGVTYIGSCAFAGCSNLTSVKANYKAFTVTERGGLLCRDKTYTVGEESTVCGDIEICVNGIHYCTNLYDIFNYYSGEYGKDFVIGVCDVSTENVGGEDDSKRCARWIIPKRILSREEVIKIMNGEE